MVEVGRFKQRLSSKVTRSVSFSFVYSTYKHRRSKSIVALQQSDCGERDVQSYGYSSDGYTDNIVKQKHHGIVAVVTEGEVQPDDSICVHKTEIISKGMKLQSPVKLATRTPC